MDNIGLLTFPSSSTVLAYACGHQECWLPDMASSRSCFATSKELLEHTRVDHPDDVGSSGPFRCALQGCGKSWKVSRLTALHIRPPITEHDVFTEYQWFAISFANVSMPGIS